MKQELKDAQWERIKNILPGKKGDSGAKAKDNRTFIESVLWIARSGAHWRALPERFGNWYTAYTRYYRWCNSGMWEKIFKALRGDPDWSYALIDSTIVRAHQHSAGAKGGLSIKPSAARKAASQRKSTA